MLPTHSPRMTKGFEILHKSKKSEQTLNQLRQHKCLFFQRRKTPEPTTSSKPNQSVRAFLGNPCQQNYPRVNTLLFNLAEFAKTLDGTWFVYNNKMFRFAEKERHRNNNKTQISTNFREVSPKNLTDEYVAFTSGKHRKKKKNKNN